MRWVIDVAANIHPGPSHSQKVWNQRKSYGLEGDLDNAEGVGAALQIASPGYGSCRKQCSLPQKADNKKSLPFAFFSQSSTCSATLKDFLKE